MHCILGYKSRKKIMAFLLNAAVQYYILANWILLRLSVIEKLKKKERKKKSDNLFSKVLNKLISRN